MDAFTLILGLLLIGGALALILYPFWQQTRPEAIFRMNNAGQTLEEYQARYQAALAAIKDLMFDYEMGKVSAEDYELLLARAKLEAANIRQHIDRLSAGTEIAPALDTEIEMLIAEVRQQGFNGQKTLLNEEVEAEIEHLKNLASGASEEITCPNCGKTVQADDAFCGRCGLALAEVKATNENICLNCGYPFQPGDAFCVKCGAALDDTVSPKYEDARV